MEINSCKCCKKSFNNKKSLSNHIRYGCASIKKISNILCKYCEKFMINKKPSEQGLFCNKVCYGKWKSINFTGENAPNFKHGKCKNYLLIRANKVYRDWGLLVFKRDNFTCQNCGDDKGGNLEAHHIYPFAKLCYENNIETVEDAKKCEKLWDLTNGTTLCKICHKKQKVMDTTNIQRVLKFRVWNYLDKCFVTDKTLFIPAGGQEPLPSMTLIPENEYIIQQFTGLYDKNKKPIYEGDRVRFGYTKYEDFFGEVIWLEDRASFGVRTGNAFETFEDLMDYMKYFEVVGNIFQLPCNPDHNGECLVCDCWLSDCAFNKKDS